VRPTVDTHLPLAPHPPEHRAHAHVLGADGRAPRYRRLVRYLWGRDFASVAGVGDPTTTPILWITILLILIGIAAFTAVLLRVS
jgi:hypothetical protein